MQYYTRSFSQSFSAGLLRYEAKKMKIFPTMEQLSAMSMHQLRSLDISSGDEELMVQTVINAKLDSQPVATPSQIRVPDIKNGEEESYWQNKIDEEKTRLQPVQVKLESIVPDATLVHDLTPIETKRFCDKCDSKGVRHKKICPSYK